MASFDASPFGLVSEWLTLILAVIIPQAIMEDSFGDLSGAHCFKQSQNNCQDGVSALFPP